ncbi:hypothetical protein [uncultured Sphingomonas sp.]|uniref:hypothetical protein n=1 Tax=uncultured Sphingomonas sp. TaxID=158754 RepID=UPI0035C94E9B
MTTPAEPHTAPRPAALPEPTTYAERHRAAEAKKIDTATQALSGLLDYLDEHGELPPEPTPAEQVAVVLADRPRLTAGGWNPPKQRAFIEHLAVSGSVTDAAAHVGMTRQGAYQLRRREPGSVFALLWDIAIALARQTLLDEATERAMVGREVPVWHRGEQVGARVVHNDRLLMFLLKHDAPKPHPSLRLDQLLHLWPVMMAEIDGVLPPPEDAAEFAALADRFGNDGA